MNRLKITWPETIGEAAVLQEQYRDLVRILPLEKAPGIVAGVDAAFSEDKVFAAVCLLRYPDMITIDHEAAIEPVRFPYVPGYLIFLEGPALISALTKLKTRPDVIIVDGHGIAHPRSIGSASHLGVLLDIPTIGCAKTPLVGKFREPEKRKGSSSELHYGGRTVGAVLRTRDDVAPVFVSPGHKINQDDAVKITLECAKRFRMPEPLRCADMLSRRMKAMHGKK